MEWVIGAAIAVVSFVTIVIAAITIRRSGAANVKQRDRAARKGAKDEEVLLI
jgi:hypothetical protein